MRKHDHGNPKNGNNAPLLPGPKSALIIFTRNPELGKCKTRLAATVGDGAALKIYGFLLRHTVAITSPLAVDKFVYYSVKVRQGDLWDPTVFTKKAQQGADLGTRMQNAFAEVFAMGYQRAVIIGSDMFDMAAADLEEAFAKLQHNDFVVGPAQDGGYYLLGMKQLKTEIFKNKTWGGPTVLKATLSDLKNEKTALLPERNDVDYYEDIEHIGAFQPFIKHVSAQ
ncbi:MAG: TIGR04282 family arsenosugar biosynthesis glycosyltransferase [Marinirhabdus sp.]